MGNEKRNKKPVKPAKVTLTPEQQAAAKEASEKAAAEAKAERERVELYGKSVEKMSHRQLSAELKKTVRRDSHFKEGGKRHPVAGLTITFVDDFSAPRWRTPARLKSRTMVAASAKTNSTRLQPSR